jgi:hypothetical protein
MPPGKAISLDLPGQSRAVTPIAASPQNGGIQEEGGSRERPARVIGACKGVCNDDNAEGAAKGLPRIG